MGNVRKGWREGGPDLVHLEKDSPFVQQSLEEGWGASWGIYALTSATMDILWKHCRSLLQAQDEQGRNLFFRFYDPRVMRVYLPTCNGMESKQVFGPVGTWMVEGENAEARLFGLREGKLVETCVP